MHVQTFELPPLGTNCHVLLDDASKQMVAVDAPLNAFATLERLQVRTGYRLAAVLMTHGHWDHTLDGHRFNEAAIPLYAHAADRTFFEQPEVMSAFTIPGLSIPPTRIDHWVAGGEKIELMGLSIEVRHVPGHSPGSVLFWVAAAGVAFCGDAIFRRGVGRTDFPGCGFEELERSIRTQIYTLPPSTRLYPGHGPATTVGDERLGNPYVRPAAETTP